MTFGEYFQILDDRAKEIKRIADLLRRDNLAGDDEEAYSYASFIYDCNKGKQEEELQTAFYNERNLV